MKTLTLDLCAKCAALMAQGYIVKKTSKGADTKVDCANCRRRHYGGTYELTKRGETRK